MSAYIQLMLFRISQHDTKAKLNLKSQYSLLTLLRPILRHLFYVILFTSCLSSRVPLHRRSSDVEYAPFAFNKRDSLWGTQGGPTHLIRNPQHHSKNSRDMLNSSSVEKVVSNTILLLRVDNILHCIVIVLLNKVKRNQLQGTRVLPPLNKRSKKAKKKKSSFTR